MAIATLSLIDFLDLNWERHLRPGTCSGGRADFHFSSNRYPASREERLTKEEPSTFLDIGKGDPARGLLQRN
jgi:hypothetical protein